MPTTNYTREQLEADVDYLAARTSEAGRFGSGRNRDTGASSNALVRWVYGQGLQDAWPRDRGDYAACVRAVRKMPLHRRRDGLQALWAAKRAWHGNEDRSQKDTDPGFAMTHSQNTDKNGTDRMPLSQRICYHVANASERKRTALVFVIFAGFIATLAFAPPMVKAAIYGSLGTTIIVVGFWWVARCVARFIQDVCEQPVLGSTLFKAEDDRKAGENHKTNN